MSIHRIEKQLPKAESTKNPTPNSFEFDRNASGDVADPEFGEASIVRTPSGE